MENWKTTLGGIAALLVAIGTVAQHIAGPGFSAGVDIPIIMAGLTALGIGWHAADAKK